VVNTKSDAVVNQTDLPSSTNIMKIIIGQRSDDLG